MEIKRILWPTDLSGNAEKALPYVKSLTEKYQTEIHVLYVIEDIARHAAWYGEFEPERIDKILQWEEKTARERLTTICENHLEGCPLYVRHVAVGDPAGEILRLVEQEKIDLVIMTSLGSRGHFRYGSVTEKVLKKSPVPVTVVPLEPTE